MGTDRFLYLDKDYIIYLSVSVEIVRDSKTYAFHYRHFFL